MKILNNTDKEICECLGPGYEVDSPWGSAYCLLRRKTGECHIRARTEEGRYYHSKEALLESEIECPKCSGYIYMIIKHP